MNAKSVQPATKSAARNPSVASQSGPRRLAGARRAAPYGGGDILSDKYELVNVLGEGSMGEVWLAVNRSLDASVAIKLLREKGDRASLGDIGTLEPTVDEFGEHLLREAQATAKVCHPSIVRIFDFGRSDRGDPFIVMEYLEGEELRAKLMRDGRMEPEACVQLLLPVMHGMQAAHVLGVVHRDLKPENIFLARSEDGDSPKVLDFGIADIGWAKTGLGSVVCGTPDYMAPEQITRNPKPDHRVDIWSLAAVIHEVIIGRVPSRSGSRSEEWLAVDPALRAVVEKGLSEDPKARWRSMVDFGEALAEWLVTRGVDQDCQGVSLRTRWLYGRDAPVLPSRSTPLPIAPQRDETSALSSEPTTTMGTGGASAIDEARAARTTSAFPDPDELGPIEIPRQRLGAWLVVVAAIALVAGSGYWARGAFSHPKVQPSDAEVAAMANDEPIVDNTPLQTSTPAAASPKPTATPSRHANGALLPGVSPNVAPPNRSATSTSAKLGPLVQPAKPAPLRKKKTTAAPSVEASASPDSSSTSSAPAQNATPSSEPQTPSPGSPGVYPDEL